jgi:hypothetical protein
MASCSGTSASKMLPLPPLWTFALSLQSADSYLWTVCPSRPFCFDLYVLRTFLSVQREVERGNITLLTQVPCVPPGTRKVTTVDLLTTIHHLNFFFSAQTLYLNLWLLTVGRLAISDSIGVLSLRSLRCCHLAPWHFFSEKALWFSD